jgi:hypothetical protein
MRKSRSIPALLAAVTLAPIALHAESITHTVSTDGKTEVWRIMEPVVTQATSEYPQIKFQPGDAVYLHASGCVQTGGHGSTWKRYVDPSGPNADRLYFGTVWIPGVVGTSAAAQAKFKDINSKTFSVPANANPAQTYLRLGYLDDGYSDNGYYSHDDGTDDQCKNSTNAAVQVTITHGAGGGITNPPGPTPDAFDLLSDTFDDNLIPLNPYWGYQKLHEGLPPSAEKLCARTIRTAGGSTVEYFPDLPPCTQQPTSRDDSWLCGPHGNWGPATVVGTIVWESHSTGTFSGDDDYSWYLTPPNGNGLTATRTTMEPEFKAAETIDHFNSPWWNDFHLGVDQGGTGPNTLIDNKLAIVSGLFSLDFEHSIHSEIHPVFAMALRVKDDDPNDETWAIFVRRFGNEGFCSSHIHYLDYLPQDLFIFRLPLKWGAATLDSEDLNFEPDADSPNVTFVPGQGVLLTFNMNQNPAARQLVSGEIHLHWKNVNAAVTGLPHPTGISKPGAAVTTRVAPGQVAPGKTVPGKTAPVRTGPVRTLPGRGLPTTTVQLPKEKEEGVEADYAEIEKGLTADQKAQVAKLVQPQPGPVHPPVKTTMRHTAPTIGKLPVHPAGTRRPSVSSVLDNDKVARDKALLNAFKQVAPAKAPPMHTPVSIPNAAASKP